MIEIKVFVKEECGVSKFIEGYLKKNNLTLFQVIDIDSDPQLAQVLDIRGIPCILVQEGDTILNWYTGRFFEIIDDLQLKYG